MSESLEINYFFPLRKMIWHKKIKTIDLAEY